MNVKFTRVPVFYRVGLKDGFHYKLSRVLCNRAMLGIELSYLIIKSRVWMRLKSKFTINVIYVEMSCLER